MVDDEVDVLIVGGGLIGALLLLALAPAGLRCLLVDNQALSSRFKQDFDARSLALSSASVRILKTLQLWPSLEAHATAIQQVHVSEQGCFGSVLLDANPTESLGYVVESHDLNRVVYEKLDHSQLMVPAKVSAFDPSNQLATIDTATHQRNIRARLVIAADGADSCMRNFCKIKATEKIYPGQALIANIGLARSHQHIAYERFTKTGPMALLPMTQSRAALVWCVTSSDAMQMQQAPEASFLNALQTQFGYRLGRFVKVGQRTVYPLRRVIMPQPVHDRVIFIGNAAHTLHPVAGQGFNLGLRDVAWLAQAVIKKGSADIQTADYQAARSHDHQAITHLTDGLIELFTSQKKGVSWMRSMGLVALDNSAYGKAILSRYAQGYAGMISDLICGIPLATAR